MYMRYSDHHRINIKRLIALLLLSIILYSCAPSVKAPMEKIPQPEMPALEPPAEKPQKHEAPATDGCINGHLSTDYPLALPDAWDAVNEALAILELGLSYSYIGSYEGTINAVRVDGDRIFITLKQKTAAVTSIAIKSSQLNNCEGVRQIHKEIEAVSGL